MEPNYALAYAGLADCYVVNFRGISALDYGPLAKFYIDKALSLDSTLSEALTTKGFIQQIIDYDWAGAKKNLKKAVDLDPNNSIAHSYYGLVLMHLLLILMELSGKWARRLTLIPFHLPQTGYWQGIIISQVNTILLSVNLKKLRLLLLKHNNMYPYGLLASFT